MAGLGLILAGAAQGVGDSIVEQARAKREAALRQQEREQERAWDVEDRDLRYGEARAAEQRGYDREDSSTNRAASALSGMYGSDLLGLIDATEGGGDYDTLFGHSQREGSRFAGVRVSDMTLEEIYEFSDPSGEYGQWVQSTNPEGVVATPMGRYQIVGTTLRNAARELGLDPSTRFTPEVQDQIARHLADRRLSSASTIDGKISALRSEWAGFSNIDDDTLAAAIRQYEAGPDAWTAAVDPSVPANVRGNLGTGLGLDPRTGQAQENPTNQFWRDNGDGTQTRYGTQNGRVVPVAGPDGQPVTQTGTASQPQDVSNTTFTRLSENTDLIAASGSGAEEANPTLVATVAEEISRLMNEEGMTETQAYTAAIQAMEFEDTETRPEGRGFLGTGLGASPAETAPRLRGFNYSDSPLPPPEPSALPSDAPTPSLPQARGMPQPKTESEMMALPPGTRYLAPDGTVRVRT